MGFYECLSGKIKCIKAPDNNIYNIIENQEYEIIDGFIKDINHEPFYFYTISDLNYHFRKDKIKFKIVEKYNY